MTDLMKQALKFIQQYPDQWLTSNKLSELAGYKISGNTLSNLYHYGKLERRKHGRFRYYEYKVVK